MNETLNNMSRNPIGGVIVTVLRMIGVALGLAFMFISLPLAIITPFVPVGLPLFVFGLLLLAGSSARAHRMITGYLKRHPGIWRRVRKLFGDKDEDETPTNAE